MPDLSIASLSKGKSSGMPRMIGSVKRLDKKMRMIDLKTLVVVVVVEINEKCVRVGVGEEILQYNTHDSTYHQGRPRKVGGRKTKEPFSSIIG